MTEVTEEVKEVARMICSVAAPRPPICDRVCHYCQSQARRIIEFIDEHRTRSTDEGGAL